MLFKRKVKEKVNLKLVSDLIKMYIFHITGKRILKGAQHNYGFYPSRTCRLSFLREPSLMELVPLFQLIVYDISMLFNQFLKLFSHILLYAFNQLHDS